MNKKNRLISYHLLAWILLSVGYCVLAEAIMNILFSGFTSLELWIIITILGLGIITISCIISLMVSLRKLRRG